MFLGNLGLIGLIDLGPLKNIMALSSYFFVLSPKCILFFCFEAGGLSRDIREERKFYPLSIFPSYAHYCGLIKMFDDRTNSM